MKHWLSIIILTGVIVSLQAGVAPFTERPRIDFDPVYKELKEQGTWEKHKSHGWAWVPKVASQWKPYRDGRWVYTDTGWLWMGNEKWSWVTDHYGFWKWEEGRWVWVPRTTWQPATVLWQQVDDLVAWRPVRLNKFDEVMNEIEELRNPAAWSTVPFTALANPLNPNAFLEGEALNQFLRKADASDHVYKTYREIERPGPDPAKVWAAIPESKKVYQIFDLPTLETKRPAEASADKLFLYRPVFAQDDEGIFRRIKAQMEPRPRQADIKNLLQEHKEIPDDGNTARKKLDPLIDVPATPSVPARAPE